MPIFCFDAFHIGEQDQFLGLQGAGNGACYQIGIDVERLPVLADTHWGDHRDEVFLLQGLQDFGVDLGYLSDPAQVNVRHVRQLLLQVCNQEHKGRLNTYPTERVRRDDLAKRGQLARAGAVFFKHGQGDQ